jgi:isoleucyl-tRNA synthetase
MDDDLSKRMALVLEVVSLGRAARVEAGLRVRQPLHEAILVLADPSRESSLADLLPQIQDELNVKEVRFAEDADRYVEYQLKPSFKKIGPRLGPLVQKLKGVLAKADGAALRAGLETDGACEVRVDGETVRLTADEIEVSITPREGYAARAGRGVVLVLETEITQDLIEEWWAREVIAAVNSLRGDRSLAYEARIRLAVWCGEALRRALQTHSRYVQGETLSKSLEFQPVEEEGGAAEGSAGSEPFRLDFEVV